MRILVAQTRYGQSGEGDIKTLSGEWDGSSGFVLDAAPDTMTVVPARQSWCFAINSRTCETRS